MEAGLRPVLIADDDTAFRALVRMLLTRAGYETVEASSGAETLAAVRAEQPALVVLDVLLPDISGFEICRELRDEFGNELPIIFVSGERVEAVDRTVGLLVGADDYVVKPFDPDEFLARVRRWIVRSQPEQALPTTPRDFDLTKREFEVLRQLADGQAPADIASELVISPKTVATHIQRILAKLGVHSRAQAVATAYQSDLLKGRRRRRTARSLPHHRGASSPPSRAREKGAAPGLLPHEPDLTVESTFVRVIDGRARVNDLRLPATAPRRRYGLPFTLLADPDHSLAEQFGF